MYVRNVVPMASNVPFGIAGKIHEYCILLQKKYDKF